MLIPRFVDVAGMAQLGVVNAAGILWEATYYAFAPTWGATVAPTCPASHCGLAGTSACATHAHETLRAAGQAESITTCGQPSFSEVAYLGFCAGLHAGR